MLMTRRCLRVSALGKNVMMKRAYIYNVQTNVVTGGTIKSTCCFNGKNKHMCGWGVGRLARPESYGKGALQRIS